MANLLRRQTLPEVQAASFFRYSTAWPVLLGPPLLAAMLMLGWRAARILRGRPHVVRNYILGLVIFLGGAVGVEALWTLVELGGKAHRVEIGTEELCEMVGVTFFLWATLDLLGSYGIRPVAGASGGEGPASPSRFSPILIGASRPPGSRSMRERAGASPQPGTE